MTWDEIMKIQDPHKALLEIERKIREENLPIQDMMDEGERYARIHGITVEDMAFYPDGDRVIGPQGWGKEEPTE